MNDEPNWFIKLFKYKVCGKGHYEGDHWIPGTMLLDLEVE